VIDPVLPPTISELVVLPVVFQYNTVPSGTLVVVTVYCTVLLVVSFNGIFNPYTTLADIKYVGRMYDPLPIVGPVISIQLFEVPSYV